MSKVRGFLIEWIFKSLWKASRPCNGFLGWMYGDHFFKTVCHAFVAFSKQLLCMGSPPPWDTQSLCISCMHFNNHSVRLTWRNGIVKKYKVWKSDSGEWLHLGKNEYARMLHGKRGSNNVSDNCQLVQVM